MCILVCADQFGFFFIGTALYAYFQQHPELIDVVKNQAALEKGVPAATLRPADYGDKVLPYFMVTNVHPGVLAWLSRSSRQR
jgi:SSS family solute:Na+ symporter